MNSSKRPIGAAALGPYQVVVTASNGTYSDRKQFTWTVTSPITLTATADRTGAEGSTPTLSFSATDSISGSTLHYAAAGLPNGLAVDPSTGIVSGSIAAGAAVYGPFSVTVTASDDTYSTSQTFTWTVTSPVTLTLPADQNSTEGDALTLGISASGSGTLAYTATGLPHGLKINTGNGDITGTIAAGAAAFGPYSVTVVAGNGTYSASQTFTWNIAPKIALTTPDDRSSSEGTAPTLAVVATGGGTLTYGATGLPTGLSINAGNGTIGGTIGAGAAAKGPYTVTLFVEDGTYSNETSFVWTVTSPVTLTAVDDQAPAAGTALTLPLTAAGSGTLTWSATGLPPGLSINSSTGSISGTPSASGPFASLVTVSNGSASASTSIAWDVSGPISITDPGSPSYNAGDALSLPIIAIDTNTGTLSYAASGLPSGLSIDSGTGVITGTISSSLAAGLYTTILTVANGTATAKRSFDWTVYPVSTLVVTNPGSLTTTEGVSPTLSVGTTYTGSMSRTYAALGLPPGLKINPSNGAISGSVSAGAAAFGPYAVTFTVTDGTASDSQTFLWSINSPLSLTNPGTQTTTEGVTPTLSLTASGSGTLKYSALGLPAGLSLNPSSGIFGGSVALGAAANGPYTVTVMVSAGTYATTQTFTWNVNSPIALTMPADRTTSEGTSLTLSLTASGGGTRSYSATGLPLGLKINPGSGDITGTVAVGTAANGPYSVTVLAEDGTSSTSKTFTWTITNPVVFTLPADRTGMEGDSPTLSITATDSTSGTLRYGALGLPPGLVINPTNGAISGTIAAGAAANGPYTVTVSAGDGTYSAQVSFVWTVNNPVAITIPVDQSNSQGDTVSLNITATDTKTGSALSYSATGLPPGLSINSSTGHISGTLTAGGSWQTIITAGDGTSSNSVAFGWSVSSTVSITDPGLQANGDGDIIGLQIQADNTASGTLSYSATGLPAGLSINSSTGVLSGTIGSNASASGPYNVTLTVTDGTHTAIDTFLWYVSQASPLSITSPGNLSSTAGDEVAFFVQADDPNSGTLMYTASGLPAGLYINPFTGLIFGTIANNAGSGMPYQVTVEAADSVNHVSQAFSWTVHAAGAVTMTDPGDRPSNENTAVTLLITANNTGSGSLGYVAFGLPPGLMINTGTGTISGTVSPGAAANGPYTVTILAGDGTASASRTFLWTVNSPIRLIAPDDQTSNEGSAWTLPITGTDSSGSLSYAAMGLPTGLKINPGNGEISGTVARGAAAQGPYDVTIIASDGTYSARQRFNWTINSPITITSPGGQNSSEGIGLTLTITAIDTNSSSPTFAALGLPAGLSIDAATGIISGTIASGASLFGSYSSTIVVSDGTSSSSMSFQWNVTSPVSLTTPSDRLGFVGDALNLTVQATGGSSPLSYAASGLPGGLSIDTGTGIISGTISSSATAIGTFYPTITVEDGTSSVSDTFVWTVSAAGTVTMTQPSNRSSTEGSSPTVAITASNGGSGTLTYFANGLPAGLKIDPSTGDITGTVALDAAQSGPYSVAVIASNGTSYSLRTFTWTITSPVTITLPTDRTTTEGTGLTLSIIANDASGTLKYSAVGLPPGLSINSNTGEITGTVALGDAVNGSYLVTVTAADGTYSARQTFTWAVNNPLTLTVPKDQESLEGSSPSPTISATGSGTLRYSAVGLPTGLALSSSGAISGTIAAGAADQGPYTVGVTVSNGTSTVTESFLWTVTSPVSIPDVADQRASTGDSIGVPIVATSAIGSSVTMQVLRSPFPLSIVSRVLTGTIPSNVSAAGSWTVRILATDGVYRAVKDIAWTVVANSLGLPKALPQNLIAPVALVALPTAAPVLPTDKSESPPASSTVAVSSIQFGGGFSIPYHDTLAQAGLGKGQPEAYPVAQWGTDAQHKRLKSPVPYVYAMTSSTKADYSTLTLAEVVFNVPDTNLTGQVTIEGVIYASKRSNAVPLGVIKPVMAQVQAGTGTRTITLKDVVSTVKFKEVNCYDNLIIDWFYKPAGQTAFKSAGKSSHLIYVTFGEPNSTTFLRNTNALFDRLGQPKMFLYQTFVDYGCRLGAGQTTAMGVFNKMWAGVFATRTAYRAEDKAELTYWDRWDRTGEDPLKGKRPLWGAAPLDFPITTPMAQPGEPAVPQAAEALLAYQDGQCTAWSELFLTSIYAQGLPGSKGFPTVRLARVHEVSKSPQALVMQGFKANVGVDPAGPFTNKMKGRGYKEIGGEWDYAWDGKPQLRLVPALVKPGQNNQTPPAIFNDHVMVLFQGGPYGGTQLYDPSYGVIYSGFDARTTLLKFQDQAVFGFGKFLETATGYTLTIRKAIPGQLELAYDFLDFPYFPRLP